MGWHCDSRYSKKSESSPNSNTQSINSPAIIFTIGTFRILRWRKKYLHQSNNGDQPWHYQKSFEFEMLLRVGNILLIHPDDEVPRYCPIEGVICNYQFGEVRFKDYHGLSIGYMFRNTTSISSFDWNTNLCDQSQNEALVPKDIYNQADISKFHNNMVLKLEAGLG